MPLPLLIAALLCLGCQPITTPVPATTITSSNGCGNLVAQIGVFQGFLETLCGCAEGDGIQAKPPAPLTCTVAPNTTVVFLYQIGLKGVHQIVGVGTPNLGTSPDYNPSDDSPNYSFTTQLPTAGTYLYQDVFNTSMNGSIVVQ